MGRKNRETTAFYVPPEQHEIDVEQWRDIDWTDGHYQVSDMGRVRRIKSTDGFNIKSPYIMHVDVSGFPGTARTSIRINCVPRKIPVGREVFRAFCGEIPDGFHVARKDRNGGNNKLSNLFLETFSNGYETFKQMEKKELKTPRVGRNKGKFRGRFRQDGRNIYVGAFNSEKEAAEEVERWIKCIANDESTIPSMPGETWNRISDNVEISNIGRSRIIVYEERKLYRRC